MRMGSRQPTNIWGRTRRVATAEHLNMPWGQHGFNAAPGAAPLPYGKPGPMTAAER
eukprot:COSAG04_NODE_1829_length_5468_cov_24.054945_4_plen_56_part_00